MNNIKKADYREVLENNGVLAFIPNGNSMWPFIKNHKQTVIIEKVTSPIKRLDVLLYLRPDGSYVLHRVVEVLDDALIMRGDSQVATEKISKNSVVGIMTSFYKGKKQIQVTDERYLKKVDKWYSDSSLSNLKRKIFNYTHRTKKEN